MKTSVAIVVVPDGVMLVFDEMSPIAVKGAASKMMAEATRRATRIAEVDGQRRELLRPFVVAGEVGTWPTFFHGVFSVRAVLHEGQYEGRDDVNSEFEDNPNGRFIHLNCTSGRVKVSSWEGLENNQEETLISLDPGKYLIGLSSDTEQQVVHEFLDAISDYPVADGPDWTVHFWAIQ